MRLRLWILVALAALCVVGGMLIYVPPMKYEQTFVGVEPTAAPMESISMANREVNLSLSSPLGDVETLVDATEKDKTTLVFDASLQSGIADLYPSASGFPLWIDFDSGKWNEAAEAKQVDRPVLGTDTDEFASALRIETGVLVLGAQTPSFLRLFDEEGEQLHDFNAQNMSPDLTLFPMANPDCAYVAKIGSCTVFDTRTGEFTAVAAPGRPVLLSREEKTLVMERNGDYVVRELSGGVETTYHLVY